MGGEGREIRVKGMEGNKGHRKEVKVRREINEKGRRKRKTEGKRKGGGREGGERETGRGQGEEDDKGDSK